ncbi:MAG: CAP domain-containing protein, partial [Acidimicrobiales bacterium]
APARPGAVAEVPVHNVRLLQLMNEERAAAGLPPLLSRPQIAEWAVRQSTAMAGRRDIWHSTAYFAASTRKALGASALGENVAVNGSLEDAHRRLMESPGHRANILNARFDAAGIGVVHDEDGTLYVTQSFVDSVGGKATLSKAKAKAKGKGKGKKATTAKARKTTKR